MTVLVNKWEDFIQNGVSIPLLTETDLTMTPEEEIKIKMSSLTLHCARAKLGQSSKTTTLIITVKNSGQSFSVHIPESETMVGWSFDVVLSFIYTIINLHSQINLSREHQSKRSKNLVVLQSDSTYTQLRHTQSISTLS